MKKYIQRTITFQIGSNIELADQLNLLLENGFEFKALINRAIYNEDVLYVCLFEIDELEETSIVKPKKNTRIKATSRDIEKFTNAFSYDFRILKKEGWGIGDKTTLTVKKLASIIRTRFGYSWKTNDGDIVWRFLKTLK